MTGGADPGAASAGGGDRPRLIHLNGPPGIGKSTLAQRYADEHPGVLDLDIDRLRGMVGGWRERFAETGLIVRPLALGMAATQLRGGRDVVLPQYLGRLTEIEKFAAVAEQAGAHFVEIVLLDDRQRAVDRFARRIADPDPWHRYVVDAVRRAGGPRDLVLMYDRLTDVLRERPWAVVVRSVEGAVDATYAAVIAALGTAR